MITFKLLKPLFSVYKISKLLFRLSNCLTCFHSTYLKKYAKKKFAYMMIIKKTVLKAIIKN